MRAGPYVRVEPKGPILVTHVITVRVVPMPAQRDAVQIEAIAHDCSRTAASRQPLRPAVSLLTTPRWLGAWSGRLAKTPERTRGVAQEPLGDDARTPLSRR